MKTVILSPNPKREQEIVYLEDIENFTCDEISDSVLMIDDHFVLLSNDRGKFQWFNVETLMIYTKEFDIIKEAVDHREKLWGGVNSIKIFDWNEFDISKVGR